jgi:RHS repeat-associated protein
MCCSIPNTVQKIIIPKPIAMQIVKSNYKYLLVALLVSSAFVSYTQQSTPGNPTSMNLNYIRTWDAVKPDTNRSNFVLSNGLQTALITTNYFDGLGRPFQKVVKQGSYPTGGSAVDLVIPTIYDEFGREAIKYLPFPANTARGNTSVNDGIFKLNPFHQDSAFSSTQYTGETWFYSQANFEASPLNRVTESFAPGNSWVGTSGQSSEANRHSIKTKYWINTAIDSVRIWTVTDNSGNFGTYASSSEYAAGVLFKNVSVDEQGNQVIEFKDKEEKTILKKVQLLSTVTDGGSGKGHYGWLCTYYIYDYMGRLRAVIQPAGVEILRTGSWNLTTSLLNDQCFRYEYDARSRMITKKVPGAGESSMVYDAKDRLVMTQDANLRNSQPTPQFTFTVYDDLNRAIKTGILSSSGSAKTHQAAAYTSSAYPNVGSYTNEIFTETFYDDYSWLPSLGNPFSNTRISGNDGHFLSSSNSFPYAQSLTQSFNTRTMITGTRVNVLGSSQYITSINYYDQRGRALQKVNTNITGFNDFNQNQYDFNGKILVSFSSNQLDLSIDLNDYLRTQIDYDDLGRIISLRKTPWHHTATPNVWTGGTEFEITRNEYDALGQLKKKKLEPSYNGVGLETLNYDYNIRGWLLGANRDYVKDAATNYFGFELGYDKVGTIISGQNYAAPQYNGNVEGTVWKSYGDGEKRKYDFTYDAANRILSADFNQFTSSSFNKTAGVDFSLSGMSYDPNGNILSMKQRGMKVGGSSTIDSLNYNYVSGSNRLLNVIDGANDAQTILGDFRTSTLHPASGSKNSSTVDYSYDYNGNVVKDLNKDIVTYAGSNGIIYNHLNLPQSITVRKANSDKGRIEYTYDALGTKLKKVTYELGVDTTVTLYVGGSVYINDTLQFINIEDGRIRFAPATTATCTPQGDRFVFDYFIKDHLGNVRMVLTDQKDPICYLPATIENSAWQTESAVYDIVDGRRIDKTTTGASQSSFGNKLYRTHGGLNEKTGLGVVLKVMSGDEIKVAGESYYTIPGGGLGSPSALVFSDVLSAFTGKGIVTAGHPGISIPTISGAGNNTAMLNSLIGTSAPSNTAEAFMNIILFDENLNVVGYGSDPVQAGGGYKLHTSMVNTPINVWKNGYAYIYVSNESNLSVYFDNLVVTHSPGPVVEETHYYPFGLTMAGISSKALAFGEPDNKIKFQNQEFATKEFSDGSGLEMYEFKWRMHDPQIGRFWQVDPLSDKYVHNSTYAFSENHVTAHVELEGKEKFAINPDNMRGQWETPFYQNRTQSTGSNPQPTNNTGSNGKTSKKATDSPDKPLIGTTNTNKVDAGHRSVETPMGDKLSINASVGKVAGQEGFIGNIDVSSQDLQPDALSLSFGPVTTGVTAQGILTAGFTTPGTGLETHLGIGPGDLQQGKLFEASVGISHTNKDGVIREGNIKLEVSAKSATVMALMPLLGVYAFAF